MFLMLVQEKMDELQAQLKQLQGEKAELSSRNRLLSSACDMRDEELHALAERQATAGEAEEDELAKSFAGSVTLTLHEDQEITLTPEQVWYSKHVQACRLCKQHASGSNRPSHAAAETTSRG